MKGFGPGLLVTAAFIGPGTVTTASYAGATFGYALLWAVLFSIVVTYTLQEMSARLGLISGQSLADAFRISVKNKTLQLFAIGLVISAIGVGNAAYQAGNITGAAWALSSVSDFNITVWSLIIGGCAWALLWFGSYRHIEKAFIALVVLMSLMFIITFLVISPDWMAMFKGLVPTIPENGITTTIAIVGTTVVPYNLFLHASTVKEKWQNRPDVDQALDEVRTDAKLSIGLGGLITMVIMATAATAFFGSGQAFEMKQLSQQLEPVLGESSVYVFSLGLFAAGMTSAIAAPLAASYAVCGALNKPAGNDSLTFRLTWSVVLLCGVAFAMSGAKPLTAILFAQAANGLLLPVIAIFLIAVMNNKKLLGNYCNSPLVNVVSSIMVSLVCLLALFKLFLLFN